MRGLSGVANCPPLVDLMAWHTTGRLRQQVNRLRARRVRVRRLRPARRAGRVLRDVTQVGVGRFEPGSARGEGADAGPRRLRGGTRPRTRRASGSSGSHHPARPERVHRVEGAGGGQDFGPAQPPRQLFRHEGRPVSSRAPACGPPSAAERRLRHAVAAHRPVALVRHTLARREEPRTWYQVRGSSSSQDAQLHPGNRSRAFMIARAPFAPSSASARPLREMQGQGARSHQLNYRQAREARSAGCRRCGSSRPRRGCRCGRPRRTPHRCRW